MSRLLSVRRHITSRMHSFTTTATSRTSSPYRSIINPSSIFIAAVATICSSGSWQLAHTSLLGVSAFHTTTTTRRPSSSIRMNSSSLEEEIKNVVAIDNNTNNKDIASITSMTSKDFLVSYPSGAYTTARTCCDATRIFEWEAHVQRTASSVASMLDNQSKDCIANNDDSDDKMNMIRSTLTNPIILRKRLDAIVQVAIKAYQEANSHETTIEDEEVSKSHDELKITALVGWNVNNNEENDDAEDNKSDSTIMIGCHITKLPPLPTAPVCVEIRGSPRENAAAKDSSWVSDRAPLEALMKAATGGIEMNELLLTANTNNEILEGSQTNFYAIINDTLYTADEGILAGTVRTLVLDVCKRNNIPVVFQPPTLNKNERQNCDWEGALISSTSRLALPIDAIYVPEEGQPSHHPSDLCKQFNNDDSSLANRIQSLVAMEVEARSTPIVPVDDETDN